MKLGKTLRVTNRKAWRTWLSQHHNKEREIWLVYAKQHTGKPRIAYGDAVEEALCFGWIDSTAKRIDENFYAQRFSPRKSTSQWSQQNIERVRRLVKLRKMTPAGLAAFKNPEALLKDKKVKIAPDILRGLKQDRQAWTNFQKFPDDYKRIRIAFIESRRKRGGSEFRKSLNHFLKQTKMNKQFVFGDRKENG